MTAIPKNKRLQIHVDRSTMLLREAKNGSDEAFRNLVLSQHVQVRVFLSKYIFCSEQIDDIAQEVFLTAYQKLDSFRNEAKFSTWLLAIARNKALQFLRKERRRQKHKQRFIDDSLISNSITSLEYDQLSLENDRIHALRDCMKSLPPESLHLVEKFYFERLGMNEIARNEGVKNGAVRMKLYRIRRRLATCVGSKLTNQ